MLTVFYQLDILEYESLIDPALRPTELGLIASVLVSTEPFMYLWTRLCIVFALLGTVFMLKTTYTDPGYIPKAAPGTPQIPPVRVKVLNYTIVK